MTARDKILMRLSGASRPLALHELDIPGVSQAAASARLREMAKENLVVSFPVPGKRFTSWALAALKGQMSLV